MEQGKTKFIRVKGRIVPIRQKASGDIDKRHVSNKMLAKKASKLKPNKKREAIGGFLGAGAGMYLARKSSWPASLLAGAVGASIGKGLLGIRLISKQEAANSLKRKKVKEF